MPPEAARKIAAGQRKDRRHGHGKEGNWLFCRRRPRGKYLTFRLGREEFAIRVLKVREIMGIQEITAVPQTPDYRQGCYQPSRQGDPGRGPAPEVRSARNRVHTADLHHRGAGAGRRQSPTDWHRRGRSFRSLNLAASDIEDTPDFGEAQLGHHYLLGMAKVKGKVKILLDIDRVLSSQELHGLDAARQ